MYKTKGFLTNFRLIRTIVVSLISSLLLATLSFVQPANAVTTYTFDCASIENSVPRSTIDNTSDYLNFPPPWAPIVEIYLGATGNNGAVEVELLYRNSCAMYFTYGDNITNEDGIIEDEFTSQLLVPLDCAPVFASARSWQGNGYPQNDPIGALTYVFTAGTSCGGSSGSPTDLGTNHSVQSINYFVAETFPRFKSRLSKPMKRFIREQVSQPVATPIKVVCTGTVRGFRWTAKREKLATQRATVGCEYIKTLYPSIETELKKRLISEKNQNSRTVRIRVFS